MPPVETMCCGRRWWKVLASSTGGNLPVSAGSPARAACPGVPGGGGGCARAAATAPRAEAASAAQSGKS